MSTNFMQMLQAAASLLKSGDNDAALAASNAILLASPGHLEALHLKALTLGRLGRLEEALPIFDTVAQSHSQRHIVLSNKGNALRAANRLEDAIKAYEAAVQAAPHYAGAWLSLGNIRLRQGEAESAETALREALDLAPGDSEILNSLGAALVECGRIGEAIDIFNAALSINPSMAFALLNRGAALRTLSKLDLALIDHRRAVELAPMHAEAQFQIANTLRQHGSLGEAETAYINALRLAPNRSDIHRELARMLWEAGESGRFLSRLDSAIESSPAPDLLNLKCEIAYLAAMPALAEAAAQDSLRLDPHGVTPKRILGLVRRHQSDFGESLALLSSALNDSPDDYDTLHSLVETLLVKGEVDQAIRYLEKEPPADRLQKHIALRANALRLAGDDSYSYFYDYERFTQKFFIEPPSGYRDLEDFNRALEAALLLLHATKTQPLDQTLFGGTQSFGRLWEEPAPVIQALKRQLLNAATRYVENLPDDPSHPFLSLKTKKLECAGAWSVVLATGGGHVDHIHPKGWVSASYYVRVPPEVSNGEKAGFLRLGASGVSGIHLEAERWYRPEEGAVIFFPSYIWHGVEPFSASTPRITAPFDLAPARGHS